MPIDNKKKKEDLPIDPEVVTKLLKDYSKMLKSKRDNLKRKDFADGGLGRTVNAGIHSAIKEETPGAFARSVNAGILTGLKYNPNMVDKIDNYSYKSESLPNMKKIVFEVRKKLGSGGSVNDDDIAQIEMLIGALEGGSGPIDWLEHDTLEDLKRDLEKALKLGKQK